MRAGAGHPGDNATVGGRVLWPPGSGADPGRLHRNQWQDQLDLSPGGDLGCGGCCFGGVGYDPVPMEASSPQSHEHHTPLAGSARALRADSAGWRAPRGDGGFLPTPCGSTGWMVCVLLLRPSPTSLPTILISTATSKTMERPKRFSSRATSKTARSGSSTRTMLSGETSRAIVRRSPAVVRTRAGSRHHRRERPARAVGKRLRTQDPELESKSPFPPGRRTQCPQHAGHGGDGAGAGAR